jgi:hypothetical protein
MKAHQTSNGAFPHLQIIVHYWQNGLLIIMVIIGRFLKRFLTRGNRTSAKMLLVWLHFHITLIGGNNSSTR